jgi:hypothetical protein
MVRKNLPVGIKICYTNQILIFGGYVKVRESLYIRVIILINTILAINDTRGKFT